MARARVYGWSERRHNGSAKKIGDLKGQAAVVRDALDRMTDAAHDKSGVERERFLATEVNAEVEAGGKLITRQDTLRVTLYYLLVFKKRGWVEAAEQVIAADPTETADEADETEEVGAAAE